MHEKTRAKDRSSLHKYRIEIPVLIDDMELSVYARSLYIHLKRRAGDDGSCWESARTLARACGMSAGQVSKAKDELEQRGLIVRNIKSVRGGIADDISLVDIWPECFRRYAPQSEETQESDHHTITSPPKRSPHDRLGESDHQVITSSESDHQVITESIKRSPHDPKNHVGDDVGGDGDRARESFFRELRRREISRAKSEAISQMDIDPPTVLASIDNLLADGRSIGHIINLIEDTPPEKGKPYERRTNGTNGRHSAPADRRGRSAPMAAPNPAVDAELAAQLAIWEREAAERGGG